tara:strand:+ start:2103 stop:2552 length:450 start_codon:yes stop_codon:yes gene_type:complete
MNKFFYAIGFSLFPTAESGYLRASVIFGTGKGKIPVDGINSAEVHCTTPVKKEFWTLERVSCIVSSKKNLKLILQAIATMAQCILLCCRTSVAMERGGRNSSISAVHLVRVPSEVISYSCTNSARRIFLSSVHGMRRNISNLSFSFLAY